MFSIPRLKPQSQKHKILSLNKRRNEMEQKAPRILFSAPKTEIFNSIWNGLKAAYGMATLAEFTQKVPRNWIKFWALSGLFTQQKVPRILKKCKQTRQGPEFERLPGHFSGLILVCLHFFSKPGDFLLCKQTRKGPEFD